MAPTRTASLRLQLLDSVSGPSKNVANSLKGVESALSRLGRGSSPEVRRLGKQLEYLQKKSGAIEDFTSSRRGLKDMSTELKLAQSNVTRLQKALASAAKPTAKMQQDLDTARSALRQTTAAFRDQGAAVRNAERSLASYGVSGRSAISRSQKEIRDQISRTIREMRRLDQEARKPQPRSSGRSGMVEAAVAAGGIYAANAGRNVAQRSFFTAVDFNQAAEYQAALGDFKGADRSALNRQAEKIGGDTRFSNVDVVRAQTAILQGGIRDSKTIMDLTNKVTEYALAMGVTLEEAAETVRGSALSKRINLGDASAIGKFVDNLVWMAKNGGLGDEDVRQYMKYAGAPTTGAALPDEYASAIAMILRRSGVRGDEAGVFARSMSSKLVAPTKKGRDSLAAMGIDYNKFVTMPDVLNEKGIGIMLKNNFGVQMSKDVQKQVSDLLENGEFLDPETGESRAVGSDSGEFVSRMSDLLAPLFAKDGKMSVQDAKALAKGLSDYHKYSVKSVDAVGLFEAIMSSNPSLGNLNAFFTDKQGGRANMIAQQFPLFQQMLGLMRNTPAGIANKIGTEANQGLYGDWTKLTGTVETALLRIGQDWEFASRPLINKTNEIIDGFTQLSENTRRLIEAFGAAIALFAGVSALRAGGSLLGRLRGGGGAVAASAAAGTASRFAPLLALSRLATPVAAMLSLKGDSANNAYTDASPEQRQKMRDQAQAAAAAINARQAEAKRQEAAAQSRRSAAAAPLQSDLAAATVSWPFAAQQGMREYVAALTQGGADAERRAQVIGEGIEDQLNIVASPDVDTGRLERALAIARQVAAALRSETSGVATSGSSPSGTPAFGGPRRKGGRVRAGVTYPVGGKGVELFTAGADGYITPNSGGAGVSAVGAAPQITNHFHFSGKATKDEASEVIRALDRQLNRSEQVLFGGANSYGDA